MSDFVIVVRELEQSCGNGLPSELAPSADIDALLTYFDRPAAQAGAGPAAPAAAPAPPAPAEAGPPAPPVPAVDDAAEAAAKELQAAAEAAAARALADAEAAAKELQAAAEAAAAQAASDAAAAEATRLATKAAADKAASDAAAEATRLAAEAVAAADAAAAAQAAADAAEAARLSDEAAAAVAAALFRDAALLESRGGIDDSIDTRFIDQMGNRPGPEARPKDAAAKQALRNFYDTDEDTEEPRPVPAKNPARFADTEPAEHVKRVIHLIEQQIAQRKSDHLARSRADAAMENAAKAKAYAEFEKRDAAGEYTAMLSDEKALVRVKMAIAQSNKDYREREAAELRQLEEKEAKRARKNGNAAAAAGRGAPKPSGRNAVTKAFRKDLREGQKSFTDDNTILPKTALRRLVRCQLDMMGKEGVCISNGMLDVLQLACVGDVGSFMASAYMSTVSHKRKTLMVKDFNDVVKIASDPKTHNIAHSVYHEDERKANRSKRNRHADA